jgi:hypothetical protein
MNKVIVEVQEDHLKSLVSSKPINAISELIWNGLDADALEVCIDFEMDNLLNIIKITITDDGTGIPYEKAETYFKNLGNSWKKIKRLTDNKRYLHGKHGKGRFKAFSLGKSVIWETVDKENKYIIRANDSKIKEFQVSKAHPSKNEKTGTVVNISDIRKKYHLKNKELINQLNEIFAPYMMQYPEVQILYDSTKIDPNKLIKNSNEFEIDIFSVDSGEATHAKLQIIEWKKTKKNREQLFLCDSNGFALSSRDISIDSKNVNITAYLRSDFIRVLDEKGMLDGDLSKDLKSLIDNSKKKIKEYCKIKNSEHSKSVIEGWKNENIYPYTNEPKDIIGQAEKHVFDVVALEINQYLPGFGEAGTKNKHLTLKLIQNAIEQKPSSLRLILRDVISLPDESIKQLDDLLQNTTLESIINASKTIADRLNFIRGLEILIFEKESRKKLLERKQLHRILAENTWIFGEEFHLSVDDESLTSVLQKHLKLLGKERSELAPVLRLDDSKGIVDMMLSRTIPQPKANQYEHLVVELKRPLTKIGFEETNQIQSYAFAVSNDERFRDTNTTWQFIIISNEIKEETVKQVNQGHRPNGLLFEGSNQKLYIWVKTWGQMINECMAKLRFYKEKLNYNVDKSTALEHLRKFHNKNLPEYLQKND